MNKSKKRHFETKVNKKQIAIICLLIIFTISFVTIFGRYALNKVSDFYTRTKEFYFYSDKLSDSNPAYKIENWSGVDDYEIIINMNSYKNNLLKSTYDINYQISYNCSSNIICTLSKDNGTISSNTNTDLFKLKITPNTALRTGDEVFAEIIATATTPYEKTIRGRFTLKVGQENLTYEIIDSSNSPYLEVNITNTLSYYTVREAFDSYSIGDKISGDKYLELTDDKKAKCYSALITLGFNPNVVVLDMTDSSYLNATNILTTTKNNYNYINQISFKMEAISSTKVRFYKIDATKDYTYPIKNPTSIITVTNI